MEITVSSEFFDRFLGHGGNNQRSFPGFFSKNILAVILRKLALGKMSPIIFIIFPDKAFFLLEMPQCWFQIVVLFLWAFIQNEFENSLPFLIRNCCPEEDWQRYNLMSFHARCMRMFTFRNTKRKLWTVPFFRKGINTCPSMFAEETKTWVLKIPRFPISWQPRQKDDESEEKTATHFSYPLPMSHFSHSSPIIVGLPSLAS